MITFCVTGEPIQKGSMRAFIRGGRAVIVHENAESKRWQGKVHDAALQAFACAEKHLAGVQVTLEFRMPRPPSVTPSKRRAPWVKPDIDKLERVILDALTGVAYEDDCQVLEVHKRKIYTAPGSECVWIRVEAA